jgi:hypothetical protein
MRYNKKDSQLLLEGVIYSEYWHNLVTYLKIIINFILGFHKTTIINFIEIKANQLFLVVLVKTEAYYPL